MAIRRLAALVVVGLLASAAGCKSCRAREECDQEARAGYPSQVSPWAHPSDTGRYVGYEVGGGAAHRSGEPPTAEEGTWGWDYGGYCLPSKVILGWWHGRKAQGGTGAYNTDGPRPLETIERRHE